MESQPGYDLDRFYAAVSQRLICDICKGVLRKPKLCKDGGHPFCHYCIRQNLDGTKTCPKCRSVLTPEKLGDPPDCFSRILDDLEIKCDYHERGCYRPIPLGNLQAHVVHCGFAPVTCKKCGMRINAKDRDVHNSSFCPLGAILKCQECENIKKTQDEMKKTQNEMKESILSQKNFFKEQMEKTMKNEEDYQLIATSINENHIYLKRKHDHLEQNQTEMKERMERIENNQKICQTETKEIMERIEKNQNEQKNDVREIKQQFTLLIKKFNPGEDQPLSNNEMIARSSGPGNGQANKE